jgi:hypothetical protein
MGLQFVKKNLLAVYEFEKSYSPQAVTVGGISVWLLFRSAILSELYARNDAIYRKSKSVLKDSAGKKIRKLMFSVTSCVIFKANYRVVFSDSPDADILFFNTSRFAYFDTPGGKYARLPDSFCECVSDAAISAVKVTEAGIPPAAAERVFPGIQFTRLQKVRLARISRGEAKAVRKLVDDVYNFFGITLSPFDIINDFFKIKTLASAFADVLTASGVKCVFHTRTYHEVSMALNMACKIAGIPSVDYQHGLQGVYNYQYTYYHTDQHGYHLYPDFFWVWHKTNADVIRKWFGHTPHQPVVGGNLFLKKIKEKKGVVLSANFDELRDKARGKKIALVAVYPEGEIFPEVILNALQESPDSVFWLLRLHPTKNLPEFVDPIEEHLLHRGLSNCEVRQASSMPVFDAIGMADCVVATVSTLLVEGLCFGKKGFTTSSIGQDIYKEYIERGEMTYTPDAQSLVRGILQCCTAQLQTTPYETDSAHMEDALRTVLGSTFPHGVSECR